MALTTIDLHQPHSIRELGTPDRLNRQYRYHQDSPFPQGWINPHNRLSGNRNSSRCEDDEEGEMEDDKVM